MADAKLLRASRHSAVLPNLASARLVDPRVDKRLWLLGDEQARLAETLGACRAHSGLEPKDPRRSLLRHTADKNKLDAS